MALRTVELHILLSLVDGDRHGYAIRTATAARTDGELVLEPGTLYRALHRLLAEGLVAEARVKGGADERRRPYRLTERGRKTALAEAERLTKLVAAIRKTELWSKA
jgi:DNA-binding PadR family transcriptional regulator